MRMVIQLYLPLQIPRPAATPGQSNGSIVNLSVSGTMGSKAKL